MFYLCDSFIASYIVNFYGGILLTPNVTFQIAITSQIQWFEIWGVNILCIIAWSYIYNQKMLYTENKSAKR